jgi:amino acid adenylation domain-containing protein
MAIGTHLCNLGIEKKHPVVVLMSKSPATIAAFLGVMYAGCPYVPLDRELAPFRVKSIVETVDPSVIICDDASFQFAQDLDFRAPLVRYGDIPDSGAVLEIPETIDRDIIYIVFTSGSTGVPKGVAATHAGVIDSTETLCSLLGADETTLFGSQTPLYVDACVKEVYLTLKCGCSTALIPKTLFSVPLKLAEFLSEHKVNTLCWVASALSMLSSFGVLAKAKPEYLRTICFGGEVFPIAQYDIWKSAYPDARFFNLYGPSEVTGVSCAFDTSEDYDGAIPIGRAVANTEVLLLNDEILIRGTHLAAGYYKDAERTAQSFVQNPYHNDYPDIVYKTGDLAKLDARGNLVFTARRDHQIKHMGYRIELTEIEAFAATLAGVSVACCVFDKARDRIILFYAGSAETADISLILRKNLPKYLLPFRVLKEPELPRTPSGKIDRVSLQAKAEEL